MAEAVLNYDPEVIKKAMHSIRIARNFERIADHTTNICEDVIYMVEGKVVKHHFDE